MIRIYYLHGSNARSELADMYDRAPGSGEKDKDRIQHEYERSREDIELRLRKAAKEAGFDQAEINMLYWGNFGSRIRYYRSTGGERPRCVPLVRLGLVEPKIKSSGSDERKQGGGSFTLSDDEAELRFELEAIAATIDHPAPTLRDVILAEPHATLAALYALKSPGSNDPSKAEAARASVSALAGRIADEAALRQRLQALDVSVPGSDRQLLELLDRELEGGTEHRQGIRSWAARAAGVLVSPAAIKLLGTTETYAHFSRLMGDAIFYFQQRGNADAPGLAIQHLLRELEPNRKGGDGVPTVVITHSLGCSVFYDLFTHFDTTIRFDLWISVGSQLSMHQDIGMLAASQPPSSDTTPGAPGLTPVRLPEGARWYNFYDSRDPIAYPSAGVFEHVQDVQERCDTRQAAEIHNKHLHDEVLYDRLKEWMEPLATRTAMQPSDIVMDGRLQEV